MTAIIGILNKQGVAIAADSAVTVMDKKVGKFGNKIFQLSSNPLIGVAVYHNLDFMGISYETIIGEFNLRYKDKAFASIEEAAESFFSFLNSDIISRNTESLEKCLYRDFSFFINYLKKESLLKEEKLHESIERLKDRESVNHPINQAKYPRKETIRHVRDIVSSFITEPTLQDLKELLIESFTRYWESEIIHSTMSGLIFFGYGENDLFPQMIEYKVGYAIAPDILRMTKGVKTEIDNTHSLSIKPFGQCSIADTLLKGIHPVVKQIIRQDYLVEEKMGTGIDSLEQILHDKYTVPIFKSLAILPVSELSKIAGSLVYLTSLIHRYTTEKESVSSPIEIIAISKGDGFVWVNRKNRYDFKLPTL